MDADLVESGWFVLGLLLIGGLYLLVRAARVRQDLPAVLRVLLESRVHYGLVGILGGVTFLPSWQDQFADIALLSLAFFGGWFGLAAGQGLDLRVMRRNLAAPLLLEGIQAGLVAILVLLAYFVSAQFLETGTSTLKAPALLMVCGICVLGIPRPSASRQVLKTVVQQGGWRPSLGALLGILLVALGSHQLGDVSFQIHNPLTDSSKSILVAGPVDKMLWSIALGGVIGLIGDLLIRGVETGALFYLLSGVVMLGSGVSASLGLEPLWVGMVAGIWLINTTLRRLDVLEVAERSRGMVKVALLFLAGWILGRGLVQTGADVGLFAWMLLLLVVLRPAGRVIGLRVAGRLLGRNALKHTYVKVGDLLDLDDVVLVVAAGLTGVLEPSVGLALLGAVMVGQLVLRLVGYGLEYLTAQRPTLAGLNAVGGAGRKTSNP